MLSRAISFRQEKGSSCGGLAIANTPVRGFFDCRWQLKETFGPQKAERHPATPAKESMSCWDTSSSRRKAPLACRATIANSAA
jgi:hypothetical protein